MVGHGSPKTSQGCCLPAGRVAAARRRSVYALVLLGTLLAQPGWAEELNVRIAWGGGPERTWRGTIALTAGTLSDPQALGVEADEPGSMWLDGEQAASRKLVVQQRSPRNYDGVDLHLAAAEGAKLVVQLAATDPVGTAVPIEVPVSDLAGLAGEFINKQLDANGNRILLMRAPGDSLRIRLARDSLVFGPGEVLKATLEPHALPLPEGGRARLKIQLLGGGRELWSRQHEVQAGAAAEIPLEIPLPNEEGVYEIQIAAINNPPWSQAVRQPLNWKRTIAERCVQLLVLSPQRPPDQRSEHEFSLVAEIDPANPRWYEKFNKLPQWSLTKNRLPRWWKGSVGNDCLQTRPHALLGEVAELCPNANSPDVSWQAYWLPVAQPGRPHILEVGYPSDAPQTLGISIVEPNAAGALMPIGLDSGLDRGAEAVTWGGAACWQRHRLIFWPRTGSPLLLLTNGREHAPAVFGKIRVLAGGERLSPALPGRSGPAERLLAAYLDRPLISENFSAEQCLDNWSGRSLADWRTFYQGGTRLIEYLNHAGYNGLMLSVLADGSTIYPSKLLMPTPRYDTGVFFTTAQDPVRKDVLEMLLRLMDREDLRLIPAVEFAAPLPELEAIRRAGGPGAQGIQWIGAEGTAWCATSPPQRGLAPYYNVLHPRVQEAMLGVLRELAERYARHPSFAGMAVRLSADGYAQLPGPDWGLDDTTIAQFERDTKLVLPGEGPQRFAQRSAFLAQPANRPAWLDWRAAQLGKFYRRAAEELAAIRPGSHLYLAGAGMFGGPELEAELRPALPRRSNVAEALLSVGIDGRYLQDDASRIVLLRLERVLSEAKLGARAADIEIGQMADFDRYFQAAAMPGSLFFHQPSEIRVPSFDQRGPFRSSYAWLVSQPVPAGEQNRRRFVHSLATLDSQVMIDGGWLLPMGQEEATRGLVAAYRSLPPVRFQPVGIRQGGEVTQPVTFRSGQCGGRTYLYAVNDAPFATTARIRAEAGPNCRLDELTGTRKVEPLRADADAGRYWEVHLEPYDLVAVQLSEPNVRFSAAQATWSSVVETALGLQIHRLGARAAALRNPPPLDLVANPGFERPATAGNPIPDWAITAREGVNIQLDTTQKHGGQQSVKMASTRSVACLVSRPFSAPTTGRLWMGVFLRVADPQRQPPLRLAIEGKLHGRDYYRFAPVGLAPAPGQPPAPIAAQWGQYVVQLDDLPLEGLSSLRVRFDLMGPGEVWIDDVQLFGLAFNRSELVELQKLITLADVKLKNGQVGDCLRLLEGYWPRFLDENVPSPPAAPTADAVTAKPRPAEERQPEHSGFLNRVKDMLPESLRF
jgi:hypothetical protein